MSIEASRHRLVVTGVILLACGACLGLAAGESSAQTSRLAALGKVWGFLKYYHPGVAGGTMDWDAVLVESIPDTVAAGDPATFDGVVRRLIQAAGGVTPLDFPELVPDDTAVEEGFEWMSDETLFSWVTRFRLQTIKQFHQAWPNRYAAFLGGFGNVSFKDELPYEEMTLPTEEYRLLSLFRYWNAIRYYFPARELIGEDWDGVLAEFIPQFREVSSVEEFHLAVCRLSARIRDSHAALSTPVLRNLWGTLMPPLFTYTLEGKVVVNLVYDSLLPAPGAVRLGDVVQAIDGVPVAERRAWLAPLLAGSTPAAVELRANQLLLRGSSPVMTLRLERDGTPLEVMVPRIAQEVIEQADQAAFPGPHWRRLPENVGFVDLTRLASADVTRAIAGLHDTRAIVFDLRGLPESLMGPLGEALNPDVRVFAFYIWPDKEHPGRFVSAPGLTVGPTRGNSDYYRGKVVILVDEWTHSRGEYTAMALQASPDALVVGSQTSGANGDVSSLPLPGGITCNFTGVSLFYPDGRGTQRVGIVADVPVARTVLGTREGRDETLEAALAWIAANVP